MKNKLINKILPVILTSSLVLPATSLITSCDNGRTKEIQSIDLSSKYDYVCKGEKLAINKAIQPKAARNQPVLWELYDAPEGVSISNNGVVSVSTDLDIKNPIQIEVAASALFDPDVVGYITLSIVPNWSSGLLGFVDGCVYGQDFFYDNVAVPIKHTDPFTYEMDGTIDIFNGASTHNALYFIPVFRERVSHQMKFTVVNGIDNSGIKWNSYVDGNWTTDIPTFSVVQAATHEETIDVSFECDPNLHLFLHLYLWLPEQNEGFFASYEKKDPSDDHELVPQADFDAIYRVDLHRESYDGKNYYDSIGKIYAFRPAYQYSSFEFSIYCKIMDKTYYNIIAPQVSLQVERIKRPYDALPYYSIQLTGFRFDESVFNASSDDPIYLFSLQALNPGDIYVGSIDFYLS